MILISVNIEVFQGAIHNAQKAHNPDHGEISKDTIKSSVQPSSDITAKFRYHNSTAKFRFS